MAQILGFWCDRRCRNRSRQSPFLLRPSLPWLRAGALRRRSEFDAKGRWRRRRPPTVSDRTRRIAVRERLWCCDNVLHQIRWVAYWDCTLTSNASLKCAVAIVKMLQQAGTRSRQRNIAAGVGDEALQQSESGRIGNGVHTGSSEIDAPAKSAKTRRNFVETFRVPPDFRCVVELPTIEEVGLADFVVFEDAGMDWFGSGGTFCG